ncbi:transposase-like protein [Robbsia andropogonis]|uniref:transposase n=1 Tax=Robbsia andropogonis TaxID=28092 RepID=UPI003D1F23DE
MKKSRYSDEQIVRILREADSVPIAEVAKWHGVSDASIYAWRKLFGEMGSDDVKRPKALQVENNRLKKLVAERAQFRLELRKTIQPLPLLLEPSGLRKMGGSHFRGFSITVLVTSSELTRSHP